MNKKQLDNRINEALVGSGAQVKNLLAAHVAHELNGKISQSEVARIFFMKRQQLNELLERYFPDK